METYILQKDLPNLKAGVKFQWSDHDNQFLSLSLTEYGKVVYMDKNDVINNEEWFCIDKSTCTMEFKDDYIIFTLSNREKFAVSAYFLYTFFKDKVDAINKD